MVEPISITLIIISAIASIIMATSGTVMIIKNVNVTDIKDFIRSIGKTKATYNRISPQGGGTFPGFTAVCKFLVDHKKQMKSCKHWITESMTVPDASGKTRTLTFKLPAPGDGYEFELNSGTKICITSFTFVPTPNPYINGFNIYGKNQSALDEFVKIALAVHLDKESLQMLLDQELEEVEEEETKVEDTKNSEVQPLNPAGQYYTVATMESTACTINHDGHDCHH